MSKVEAARRLQALFDWRRAAIAAILLGALFALLFFVLLPRGGAGSTPSAERIETTAIGVDAEPGVHPGNLARDFEASNLEGVRYRLSNLRGRPVVVNFWATWCTSCAAEMPALDEQRRRHADDGLAIVAVNVGESTGDARDFIERFELFEFAVAMDPDLTVSDMYAVRGLPHSIFIDRDGVIRAEYAGELDADTMGQYVQAAIDAVPGGEPPDRLRFITTVPREHELEVLPEAEPGTVHFLSRRFRCDQDYCAEPLAEDLDGAAGVTAVALNSDADEPALTVTFDVTRTSRDAVVELVADALRDFPDPLYTRDLEVVP